MNDKIYQIRQRLLEKNWKIVETKSISMTNYYQNKR